MISLIIPTNKTNTEYTINILNNIKEIYPDVDVVIEENNSITLGLNYNNAVAKAKGEKATAKKIAAKKAPAKK